MTDWHDGDFAVVWLYGKWRACKIISLREFTAVVRTLPDGQQAWVSIDELHRDIARGEEPG